MKSIFLMLSTLLGGCTPAFAVAATLLLAGCGGEQIAVITQPHLVTVAEIPAQPHHITWADTWLNLDGTAGLIVGDDQMYIYDGHDYDSCPVSYTERPDYLRVGPCNLATPGGHTITATVTVRELVGYGSHYYEQVESEVLYTSP